MQNLNSYPRHQHIHCCHCLPIVILTHIKRFYLLRIVSYNDRASPESLLCYVPFMLALQIEPPLHLQEPDLY